MDPRDFRKELKNKGIDDLLVKQNLILLIEKLKKDFQNLRGQEYRLQIKKQKRL